MPRESLDAAEDLPEGALSQVAFGELAWRGLQEVAKRLAGTFQGTQGYSEVAARPPNSDNPSTRP